MAREIKFWRESLEPIPWATGSIYAGVRANTNVPPRGVVSISLTVFATLSEWGRGSCLLPHFGKCFFRSKHICCGASGWRQAELLQIFCQVFRACLPCLPQPLNPCPSIVTLTSCPHHSLLEIAGETCQDLLYSLPVTLHFQVGKLN